jgi:hypothetical protein
VGRDGDSFSGDLGESKTRIFFQKGLDGPNHIETVQQNRAAAQADVDRPVDAGF